MLQTLSLLIFLAVFGAMMAAAFYQLARRARITGALRRRLGVAGSEAAMLLRSDEHDAASQLTRLLAESGLGWSLSAFTKRTVSATLGGALAGLLLGGAPLALLFALIALPIFWLVVWRARRQRYELCNQQMPQALEIMSLALRAGHPLPSALAVAAAEAPSPIADELRRAIDEHDLGRPIGDVLVGLGARLEDCESVHTFVVAVLVLQQTGGNLIAVIDRIVENARARAQYESRLRALTAEGRMSAKIMAFLPVIFVVAVTMIDPTYITMLILDPTGRTVGIVCVALWGGGIAWTQSLVQAKA